MKNIFRFFAERSLVSNIFMVMILLVGLTVAASINKDLFPRVKLNRVIVMTNYTDAAPEDIELNITNKIEKHLRGIDGVKDFTSTSSEGKSLITVNIDEDLKKNKAQNVVNTIWEGAVARVKDLPPELENKPLVYRISGNFIPVIGIGIHATDNNYGTACKYAKFFEKKIATLEGVARVERTYRKKEVVVEIIPEKLKEYQLSAAQIAQAINKRHIRSTAGKIVSLASEKNIVMFKQFATSKDVGNVIIRATFNGPVIKVKDVANIFEQFSPTEQIAHINGKKVIFFDILKKENADIVKTVNRVKALIEKEKMLLPKEIEILYSNDLSRYVNTSFNVVVNNGLTGFLLVIIILTIFLNWKVSFWVAMGIPVSLLGAIALLPKFNVTLDVITLTSMILVLGIIVDDAIVISERIYRRWEMGEPPLEAAVNGLNDVFWPVVTTVLSTLLAFMPMFLIPGEIGKFIRVVPLVVSLALIISLIESIVILPAHICHGLNKSKNEKQNKITKMGQSFFIKLKTFYIALLKKILPFRYMLIIFFSISFLITIAYLITSMKIELFPSKGAEDFTIHVETPIENPLSKTALKIKEIESHIESLPKTEIVSYTSHIGREETNRASIAVNLTPYSTRERNANEIVAELRDNFKNIKDVSNIVCDVSESGPNPAKPVSLRIVGEDDTIRTQLATDVISFLQTIKDVSDIQRDDKKGKEQINIKVDSSHLASLGLNEVDIAQTLKIALKGLIVTKMHQGQNEILFKMKFPKKITTDINNLLSIHIPNESGKLIPLKTIAQIEKLPGLANFKHFNGERTINIQANISPMGISPVTASKMVLDNFNLSKDYPGMRIVVEGAAKKTQESYKNIGKIFLFSLLGIYFLLVILFNSKDQPFIVLSAVPFGIMGVIIVFAIHGEPLSFMGMLGVIGLAGVVVNDSLIMIDHLNITLKEKPNQPLLTSVIQGSAERLRAVVITTITTSAGLLPLAYGIGGANPTNAPMALALGWGLLIATPLTLVLIPALYMVSNDLGLLKRKIRKKTRLK